MIFDNDRAPNWEEIRRHRQKIIEQNNKRENAKRIKHEYRAGDLVLYKRGDGEAKHSRVYDGPYTVEEVYANGNARIARGRHVSDRVNIRLLKPYKPSV
jgi:hypothetical protein